MSDYGVMDSPAGAAQTRGSGVTIGVVIENKDPNGLAQIQIKLPAASDDEMGHWARLAMPMAGSGRGMFFLPEKGDEVLVAFEQGDITRPFIIGALWNGKDKPPDTNSDGKNNLRFIQSRSGHIVRLDDTDGSEKIEIIDKSGNNSITFDTSSNTITIKSDQDITLEAPKGTIKLDAQKVEISASDTVEMTGQGGVTVDGTPGTTAVKGSTVNIN